MGTDYILRCDETKRSLDLQGLGAMVQRDPMRGDGTVTAEEVARAGRGSAGLYLNAALWVESQKAPVHLVSEHEDDYDVPPDWTKETLFGPDCWQKRLIGHGYFVPTSWGIKGADNPKGMTRLKIVR
jgi:hypothetical protein